ncbi:MAG: phosphoglucomutase/phosphomannomutase family protein [Acidobacteria bacterium]|nr:phosphoglucomutase/phosphomannomutase family protein [Acidobacteriota bacterium]
MARSRHELCVGGGRESRNGPPGRTPGRGGTHVIRFGTSGWRAVIAEEFTIRNVRRVAAAVAMHLAGQGTARRGVFIGFDTRFMSDRFAREAAAVLAQRGVPVSLSPAPVPTPVVAFAIVSGRRAGGLNVTASHNPPEYNGLKFSTAGGAPALPEITRAIESLANSGRGGGAAGMDGAAEPGDTAGPPARILSLDMRAAYFRQMSRLVCLPAIRKAGLRVACDLRHGASIGYLDGLLRKAARSLEALHDRPDPLFGGSGPDCGETQLQPLGRLVKRQRLHLGLATDGDGDRFGIVDRGGRFIQPNLFLAVLADYLLTFRRLTGGVGRSVATTHLLDAVCAFHGRKLYETPVGFKFLGDHLKSGRAFLVCEESAGLSLRGHVPEKDGILAGLLAAEMVAVRRKSIREQARELFRKVGPLHSRRIDYHMDAPARDRLARRLEDVPASFAGRRIARLDTTDGRKMIFHDGSWLLLRPSGTEPVVRCYAEARAPRDVEALLAAARNLIQ